MKKALSVIAAFVILLNLAIIATAAPLTKDQPKGSTAKLPKKGDANVLVYEDFESNSLGLFTGSVPDDTSKSPAKVEVVPGGANGGKYCVKVSGRGETADGSFGGYNTIQLPNIAQLIAAKFKKDPSNANHTETYYCSAWVKNDAPDVKQTFWVQLQYGGSAEVWLTGANYYETKGNEWKQIGIAIRNGQVEYQPFTEDTTKSGIYEARGTTTWSALKFITKEPRDADGNVKQTGKDFYIDDIVIWKVDNDADIIKDSPASSPAQSTSSQAASQEASSQEAQAPSSEIESSPEDTESAASDSASKPDEKKDEKSNTGLIIAIIAAAVIIGGGVFGGMMFMSKNKKSQD